MAMEAASLVMKVKYGNFLRRFNASVTDDKLHLSMGSLIEKICILFNLATDSELTLTYIDEDGETVTLVDDDDLRDVVGQALNPLRITVTMNQEKNNSPVICPTGSSTPLSSSPVQHQFRNINSGVSEILKTTPNPICETLAKLSTELVSGLSPSAPGMTPGTAEIVEYFSKVGLSCLSQISELLARVQPNSQNDVPERRATVTETKDSDLSKVDPITQLKAQSQGGSKKQLPKNNENPPKVKTALTMVEPTALKAQSQGGSKKQLPRHNENSPKFKSVSTIKIHEVKVGASEGTMEASSSKAPGIDAVARSIEDVNKNLCDSEPILHNSKLVPDHVGGSSYASFNVPFVANNVSTGEKVNKSSGPHLGPNPACAGAHERAKHISFDFGKSPRPLVVPNPGSFSNYPRPSTDLPAIHPHHWPSTGLHDLHAQWHYSLDSPVHRGMEVKKRGVSNLDSCFIVDVTMIDGTLITPLTPFTKIWRMKNNGTLVWPKKTRLVWIGGDRLSNSSSLELPVPAAGLAVNKELDVAVGFISPELPGLYVSYWRMAAPSGLIFGQSVWVHIQVQATIEEAQHGVWGLNLNLPPVKNALTASKVNNDVMYPLVEDIHPVEVFEPITLSPNIEQDMKFPMSDSSKVGSGATNMASTAPRSIVYPVIDQADITATVYPPPYEHYPSPPSPVIFHPTSPFLYAQPAPPVFHPLQPPPPPLLYPPPPPPVTFPPHLDSVYASPSPPSFYSWSPGPPAGDTLENTEDLQGMDEVEEELLMELEEMGFGEVDLNKEILRIHAYDLQQTLKDLYEITGWESDQLGAGGMKSTRKCL